MGKQIVINKKILTKMLNDDILNELQRIMADELDKPIEDIDCAFIDECVNVILSIQ